MSIKLATWNIGSLYVNFEENVHYIEDVVSRHPQDILCMQEFPEGDSITEQVMRWGNFEVMEYVATSESHIHKGSKMGVAIFSKRPIRRVDTIQLPLPNVEISHNGIREYWHTKYFSANICAVEDGELLLITGHGFPFHRYRLENQEGYCHIHPPFAVLDDWIKHLCDTYTGMRICMAADFNITAPLSFMPYSQEHFFDVFNEKATRPSGRKTDAIILPIGCQLLNEENFSLKNSNNIPVFDHNFIAAEFDCD